MKNELIEKATKLNGKRKDRVITPADVDLFIETFEERKDDAEAKMIRVYPALAFVPNAYKWRADVTVLYATRDSEGNWITGAMLVDAHRPKGNGPRVTVNNRSI